MSNNQTAKGSLLTALAAFQRSVKPIVKDTVNPFFKRKYAALDTIQKHIRPDLDAAGLVVIQSCQFNENGLFVETRVIHVESGESASSFFPVIAKGESAQDYGSAVSYAKRYSLTGLLNLIVADEDDDANSVSRPPEPQGKPALNDDTLSSMLEYVSKGKSAEVTRALNKYSVSPEQSKAITDAINLFKAEATKKAASK